MGLYWSTGSTIATKALYPDSTKYPWSFTGAEKPNSTIASRITVP